MPSLTTKNWKARPKINVFLAPRLTTKSWMFKDRMKDWKVKSWIILIFYLFIFLIWPPVAVLPSEAGDGLEEQYSYFT